MDDGFFLVALVVVLAVVALVLVGASKPDGERKRRDLIKESHKALDASAKRSGQRVAMRIRNDADEAPPVTMSALIVPPPDESRIEAVAPKNEPVRRAV